MLFFIDSTPYKFSRMIVVFLSYFVLSFNYALADSFALDEIEFAKELQQKYIDALSKTSEISKLTGIKTNEGKEAGFYIFVSFNLGKKNLKNLAFLASKYKGVLVVRGLIDNNFVKTAAFVKELSEMDNENNQKQQEEQENTGIIIDPTLFQKYDITHVPSFILAKEEACPVGTSCKPIYDKLTGNVTPLYVLNLFSKSGDLNKEALKLLEAS